MAKTIDIDIKVNAPIECVILATNFYGSKVYYSKNSGLFKGDENFEFIRIGTDDKIEKSEFTSASSNLNNTSGNLNIKVTGENSETITWTVNRTSTITQTIVNL